MKKIIPLLIAYLLLTVAILQADEISKPESEKAEAGLNVGIKYWPSTGDAGFGISGTDPDLGPWNSVIEYPMDGNFLIFSAQYCFVTLLPKLSIDLNYGFSSDIDGTTKDIDHLLAISASPYIYSETDTDADSSI